MKKNETKVNELIKIIEEITKYGLDPNLNIEDKEKDLEKHLVRLYAKFFEINYIYDDTNYEDYENLTSLNIRNNVSKNFPGFGFYHKVINSHKIIEEPENAIGDAIDDLSDIIIDLLEIKWRNENTSERDAWWFFELTFYTHTQRHLISLLDFMKSKNG